MVHNSIIIFTTLEIRMVVEVLPLWVFAIASVEIDVRTSTTEVMSKMGRRMGHTFY